MAPTYMCRDPGIENSDGHRGSALYSFGRRLVATAAGFPSENANVLQESMTSVMRGPASANPKVELRRAALARRDALPAAERAQAAEAIAARAFPVAVAPGTIVAGFMPMKSEINPLPLMRRLADAGAQLALPAVVGQGQPLIMRAWAFGEPLAAGVWGIREPEPTAPAVAPDILIVPLLAFDRAGHRIGYGAGYYDLTIAALRGKRAVVAVGLAFAAQEIAAVPATPRDVPLDLVLTEREVIDLRRA
jgi:5-formyltetrahydrofolate cyclo-ligase